MSRKIGEILKKRKFYAFLREEINPFMNLELTQEQVLEARENWPGKKKRIFFVMDAPKKKSAWAREKKRRNPKRHVHNIFGLRR